MIGRTFAVQDHGTIVQLWVAYTPEGDTDVHEMPVHFDHRMFHHLVVGRGVQYILYQDVEVTFGGDDGPTVRFLDEGDDA